MNVGDWVYYDNEPALIEDTLGDGSQLYIRRPARHWVFTTETRPASNPNEQAILALKAWRNFATDVERECRNELVRGELQGFAPDGPHAELWTDLRNRAQALLLATHDVKVVP